MSAQRFVASLIMLLAMVLAHPSQSQQRHADVSLLPEQTALVPGALTTFALHMAPQPGWHTYWSNPGDAGIVTSIDWRLPPGFEAGGLRFPTPETVPQGSLMNYGYGAASTLLVDVKAAPDVTPGSSVTIDAHVNWLVCDDKLCVPEDQAFSLSLPVAATAEADPRHEALFAKARASLPQPAPWPVAFNVDDEGFLLRADFGSDAIAPSQAWFFPHDDGVIPYAAPQRWQIDDGKLYVRVAAGAGNHGDQVTGVLKLRVEGADEAQGYVISAARAVAMERPPVLPVSNLGLAMALVFAVLGGVMLNTMPCVFPVLSLKALSLAKFSADQRRARSSGIFYTLGVLTSFAVIAVILIGLRMLGAEIGWGFQLQSTLVVVLLAYLMFLIGLNLMGVYEVGGSMMALGDRLIRGEGRAESFLTGILAAVVAAPCTAPFMGAAMGFAMVQPAPVAMAIFLGLGLGLALPYLLVAWLPWLRQRLPRPGAWMEAFKQFLAFPMFATALWLIWVLGQQGGLDAVMLALAGLVLLSFALWAWRCGALTQGRRRASWRIVAAGGLVFALLCAVQADFAQRLSLTAPADLAAETFTPQRLAALRADNKPVFVYFTAAWCITCKVNERVALETVDVQQAMQRHGVQVLKADWTKRDDVIARTLRDYGRSGVPLYLFFPAGGEAVILPQVLTPGLVIDAIGMAGGATG